MYLGWDLCVVVETVFALETRKCYIILGDLFNFLDLGNMSVCSVALVQLDMVCMCGFSVLPWKS